MSGYTIRLHKKLTALLTRREERRERRLQEAHVVCCRLEAAYKAAGMGLYIPVRFNPRTGRYSVGRVSGLTQAQVIRTTEEVEATAANLLNPDEESC